MAEHAARRIRWQGASLAFVLSAIGLTAGTVGTAQEARKPVQELALSDLSTATPADATNLGFGAASGLLGLGLLGKDLIAARERRRRLSPKALVKLFSRSQTP